MKESGKKVTINEKFVIDLDNDLNHSVLFYVDKINKNNLDQAQKDFLDAETIGEEELKSNTWSQNSKSIKINTSDNDERTEIVINAEAYKTNSIPSRDTMPSLLEGEVALYGRDVLFKDKDKIKYPQTEYLFNAWG